MYIDVRVRQWIAISNENQICSSIDIDDDDAKVAH